MNNQTQIINQKLESIMNILKQKGQSDEEINKYIENLNNSIYDELAEEFEKSLDDQKGSQLDNIPEELPTFKQIAGILGISQEELINIYVSKLDKYSQNLPTT